MNYLIQIILVGIGVRVRVRFLLEKPEYPEKKNTVRLGDHMTIVIIITTNIIIITHIQVISQIFT